MEDLFTTDISVNNQNIKYRVVFGNEQYVFIAEASNTSFARFSFRREHDEWLSGDSLPSGVKEQAINALEKFLLRQH